MTIGDAAARPDTGVHWELPVLIPVGHDSEGRAKHAFFVTPWWPEPCEHSLLYQWYWVGEWDAQAMTWTPDHDEPRLLDVGGFFTGVTASRTQDGRTLLWTIAQDLLSEEEHARRGWAGSAGLPVEVWFDDGDLRIAPARELKSLRDGTVVDLVAEPDVPLPGFLPVAAGPTAEIEVMVDLPLSGSVEIAVRATSGADPAAVVVVTRTSPTTGRVDVVRPHGREPARQHRVGEDLRLPGHEAVRLHAYLDHSMVEVYVQNHRSVTTRAWAAQGADDSGWVRVAGGARLTSLRVWALREAVVTESR
jgi:sucrose-6-phosphate hydrolase SacC (GH32 family)